MTLAKYILFNRRVIMDLTFYRKFMCAALICLLYSCFSISSGGPAALDFNNAKMYARTENNLEEAERLCKNLAIIHKGTIIQHSSMEKVFEKRRSHTYILKTSEPINEGTTINGLALIKTDKHTYEITISNGVSVTDIIEKLKLININVVSMSSKRNILEELFIELTKEKTQS